MYTAGQTTDSILHNTPLSAHGFTAAARAAGMNQDWEHHPASVNYVPDYRSRRLFGNLPLAQATGDLPPVHLNGKVTYMNPTHMQGVVVGRGQCLATGEYVGGEVSLRPLGSYGGLAGGYRVDDVVHTTADGVGMEPAKWEKVAVRPSMLTDRPCSMNIPAEDEYCTIAKENAARINAIRAASIKLQLAAYAMPSF